MEVYVPVVFGSYLCLMWINHSLPRVQRAAWATQHPIMFLHTLPEIPVGLPFAFLGRSTWWTVLNIPLFSRLALPSSFRVKPGLCTYESLSSFRRLFSQSCTASYFSTIISMLLARSPPILLSFPWLSLSIPQSSVLSPLFRASTLDGRS